MTTKLTHTARTILRSRVRRHPKNGPVLSGRPVSDLSNADLLQAALLLELDAPTEAECFALEEAKRNGRTGRAAIAAADEKAALTQKGGKGFDLIHVASTQEEADADDADDDNSDDDDTPAEAPAAPAKVEPSPAEQLAAEVRAKLGQGDFEGFNRALVDLAEKALKPATVQHVAPVDPSKIKGHVPSVTGRKTAKQVGLSVMLDCRDDATALDVYDAPDAPRRDPDYIWPDATGSILATLAHGGNVFLYGPAGTGKTTFAKQVAAHWGRPFVRVSCHNQTEAATLVGMTVPEQGNAKWQDGQLAAAIRKPGTVVLVDEPSVARAGALFVLQALLDDDRAIHVEETGETIHAAPGVLVLLADNTNGTGDTTGQYEGTQILNRATLDRASITVRLDYMDPTEEAAALVSRTGCNKKAAAALVKFANLTRTKADAGALAHGLGFRRLSALARQISFGVDPNKAFQRAVVETAPYDDKEPLRQMWEADMNTNAL